MADEISHQEGLFEDQTDPGLNVLGVVVKKKDVDTFVSDVLADSSCKVCMTGRYDAFLYAPTHDRVSAILSVEVSKVEGEPPYKLNADRFMPVFHMVCNTCGNVRQHTLAKVLEWKALMVGTHNDGT